MYVIPFDYHDPYRSPPPKSQFMEYGARPPVVLAVNSIVAGAVLFGPFASIVAVNGSVELINESNAVGSGLTGGSSVQSNTFYKKSLFSPEESAVI